MVKELKGLEEGPKAKIYLNLLRATKIAPSKQLQTPNKPTDDVENTNGTNQGGDLQIAN